MASFTPRSAALLNYPRPEWVSPTTGSTIPATEPLVFKSVARSSGTAHFNVQGDSQSDFSTATNYRSDRGGFEYWNGTAWTAIPTGGVPTGATVAYPYWRPITIDTTATGANILSNLTSFPVCIAVNLSSWSNATERSNFFGSWNLSGKRVRFIDGSGTTLAYEVESYDATTPSAVYWVNVPTITGNSLTTIYVGYGADPIGADQEQRTASWSNGYKSVWHMGDNAWSASSPQMLDSTSSGITGTNTGTTSATGVVGGGRTFSGSTQYITLNDTSNALNMTSDFTVSYWVYVSGIASTTGFVFKGRAATSGWRVGHNGAYHMFTKLGVVDLASTTTVATNAWRHVAWVVSGSKPILYVSGAQSWDSGNTQAITSTTFGGYMGLEVGSTGTLLNYFNGRLDEVRISNSARSADWVKAEYWSTKLTTWVGDGWLSFGSQQTTVGNIRLTTDLPPGSQYIRVRQSK